MWISQMGCWVPAESSHSPLRKQEVTFEPAALQERTRNRRHFLPDSSFKLPLKRKLRQRLWCNADMLRHIHHKCRHKLHYHSNEFVQMSFKRLRFAQAGERKVVVFFNRTWKRWLITRNGKRRKMVLRCPLACDLSQYSTWRPARVFLMKTCGT